MPCSGVVFERLKVEARVTTRSTEYFKKLLTDFDEICV